LEAVREQLPAEVPLIVGQRLKALGAEDASQLVTVTEVGEDTVRLDANHPLAGQVLHFEISIVAVREPSEAERAQGFATSVNP